MPGDNPNHGPISYDTPLRPGNPLVRRRRDKYPKGQRVFGEPVPPVRPARSLSCLAHTVVKWQL
ncbi:hypothetical protein GCM10010251_73220 [Streptomyces aurantiogriseus]|uniref:Uncharacterized protein n=1 Tax=Streptomyces aurantiogriseus TaxID=66870 RepID=A0A918FJZ7_9ACTN|nr:hypothetical protein GCM10010251_73220 [Streptomyces aurantiogriseus]